ncbi:E3 ubiquitin-protein ligase RNF34 [Megachile rotundata]|uniref:E3 ubiquitin-protein ligase RNF34 n=1 Tax=Megachile rotundata TaxID=143995 RepID=UPI000258E391|nr:PREDICTED: E3 ubiquitin-protein ligase RNF34 [Megachile rotundata]XP_012139113.1 PREDICTED: E3 ubiquitin-protein ligase RNF34 [Megachile rotundata]
MACEACRVRFTFFTRKKQCTDCLRYFCSECVIKRSDKVLSCDSCSLLSRRPLIRSQIVQICSKDLRKYLLAKKIPINGCIEKEDLIKLLMVYANNNGDYSSTENTHVLFSNRSTTINHESTNRFQNMTNETESVDSGQENSDTLKEILTNPVQLSDINTLSELECLSIKQLKNLLSTNRVNYKGCVEKQELLDRASRLWKEHEQSRINVEIPDENLCKICWDEPIECVILECGHMACCLKCGKQLSECPICKQYIVRVVRFFKS